MNTIELFWYRVDKVLEEYEMSVAQLSRATSISYDAFKAWRSRKRIPDVNSLIKISNTLNVSLDFLLKGMYSSDYEFNNEYNHSPTLRKIIMLCEERPRFADAIATLAGIVPECVAYLKPRTVGERIIIALRSAGITEADVEELSDIGADEVAEFEDGYVEPTKEQLDKIAKITQCSLFFLEHGDSNRNDKKVSYVK